MKHNIYFKLLFLEYRFHSEDYIEFLQRVSPQNIQAFSWPFIFLPNETFFTKPHWLACYENLHWVVRAFEAFILIYCELNFKANCSVEPKPRAGCQFTLDIASIPF